MHSSLQSASSEEKNGQLKTILERATPFINGELQLVDPKLPSLLSLLRSLGAAECWHKYGTFFDHLLHIYKILKLWNFSNSVSLSGLFHSAYSNSYVNPSIFNPSTSRQTVRDHIGEAAERLIYLFCNVPRHSVIHGDLISNFTDQEELIQHLKSSETSLRNAKEMGIFNSDEEWRKKLNSIISSEGKSVKLIDTGEEIVVSRRVIAVFVCMTVADFSEQIFGYQDDLFENENGRLESSGNNLNALWPGDGKPGLWMNYISRMGAIYSLLVREEEIFIEERKRVGKNLSNEGRDEEIELVIPPVLENCTRVLDAEDQIMARDLYWEAVCNGGKKGVEIVRSLLTSTSTSIGVKREITNMESKKQLICQLCDQASHSAISCCWMYSKCSKRGCPGIRMLLQFEGTLVKGKKYLKCQFPSCDGFQWLDEALANANGSSSFSKCYYCGDDDHKARDCPWDGCPCPKQQCKGIMHIGISHSHENEGKKFVRCEKCEKFEWLADAIAKHEATTKQQSLLRGKGMQTPSLHMDELCDEFMNKSKMPKCCYCNSFEHHGSNCHILLTRCVRNSCNAEMKLGTSGRAHSYGKKFFSCTKPSCSGFMWLEDVLKNQNK